MWTKERHEAAREYCQMPSGSQPGYIVQEELDAALDEIEWLDQAYKKGRLNLAAAQVEWDQFYDTLRAENERLEKENAALRERADLLAEAVRCASSPRMTFLSGIDHCRMCGAWAWNGDNMIHDTDCPVPVWEALLAKPDIIAGKTDA